MHLLLSPSFVLVLLVSCALAPPSNAVGKQASSAARVDSLHRHAVQSLSSGTIERRREAIRDLEQATAIEPRHVDLWVDLAEALQQAGRFDRARAALGRVTRLKPEDCDAWVRLGEAWKHDWLMSLDRESLAAAQRSYASACALDSSRVDTWCALSALALLEGRPRDAFIAALRARALDRNGAAPLLVMGAALFRLGNLDVASRAFEASRDQLPPALQRLYDSREAIGVAAHGEATEDGLADRVSAEASWEAIDPDRTTPENEARLDYLTRLALALFLFQDGTSLVWDKRAEMFVRYGPPTAIQFNPAGAQIGWGANLEFQLGHGPANGYAPGPHPYPYNMQLWQYADLGMEFVLWDRSLSRHYELPPSFDGAAEPRPDPDRLVEREDLVALGNGHGVFRTMPPGSDPMSISTAVSRFPAGDQVVVVVNAFVAGSPTDTLHGAWAMLDESGRVVAHDTHVLTTAACDPGSSRVATFAASVPAGEYRIDLTVSDARSRRGLTHLTTHIAPGNGRLALGDLVLLCGGVPAAFGANYAGIEPNLEGRVSERAVLSMYYELDRLATGPDGQSHFSYTYSIRPNGSGAKSASVVYEATREEFHVGSHRRQFVSVADARLPPGAYVLTLEVKDVIDGDTVHGTLRFWTGDRKKSPSTRGARSSGMP